MGAHESLCRRSFLVTSDWDKLDHDTEISLCLPACCLLRIWPWMDLRSLSRRFRRKSHFLSWYSYCLRLIHTLVSCYFWI